MFNLLQFHILDKTEHYREQRSQQNQHQCVAQTNSSSCAIVTTAVAPATPASVARIAYGI